MLTTCYKVKLTTDISEIFYRNPKNKKLSTRMMSGDRVVWVHPDELKDHPLPRYAQCGTFKCRIFHRNQFPDQAECYNCFKTDHKSANCPNEKCCRVCKEPGHKPGSPSCMHYVPKQNLRVYGGYKDPLSNHYRAKFTFREVEAWTVENHWFYQKGMANGQPELALMCLEARTGADAKYIAKGIRCAKDWDTGVFAQNLMRDIQLARYEQVDATAHAMQEAHMAGTYMVEAVPKNGHSIWSTTLDKEATLHTAPDYWPGENRMGQLLNNIVIEKFGPFWVNGRPPTPKDNEDNQDDSDGNTDNEDDVEPAEETTTDTVPPEGTEGMEIEPEPQPALSGEEQGKGPISPSVDQTTNAVSHESDTDSTVIDTEVDYTGDGQELVTPCTPKPKAVGKLFGSTNRRPRSPRPRTNKGGIKSRSPRSPSVKRSLSPKPTEVKAKIQKVSPKVCTESSIPSKVSVVNKKIK